jgi:hypothetical protein
LHGGRTVVDRFSGIAVGWTHEDFEDYFGEEEIRAQ